MLVATSGFSTSSPTATLLCAKKAVEYSVANEHVQGFMIISYSFLRMERKDTKYSTHNFRKCNVVRM